jgi:hypothetical protein
MEQRRKMPTRRSTLFIFDGNLMFMAELDLTDGIQTMLGMPIGEQRRWIAWAGVLTALQGLVEQARPS